MKYSDHSTIHKTSDDFTVKNSYQRSMYFQNQIRGIIFDIVVNNCFEMTIMFIIALNMATMMLQHYGQSQSMNEVLDILFDNNSLVTSEPLVGVNDHHLGLLAKYLNSTAIKVHLG